MMVDKMPYVDTSGQFFNDLNANLNAATNAIKTISNPKQLSTSQLEETVKVLSQFNAKYEKADKVFIGKHNISDDLEKKTEKALLACKLFFGNFRTNPNSQRDMGQTVLPLFDLLNKEMDKFSRNLKKLSDLKKLKRGQKVEETDTGQALNN